MSKDETIKIIIEFLKEEFGEFEGQTITPATSLVSDLKIETDDLSFLFIPGIEKIMCVELSYNTWSKIETVAEIADAFELAKKTV